MEEKETSNLYSTPLDRINNNEEEKESLNENLGEEFLNDSIHTETKKNDENRVAENKKIRTVLFFLILSLINIGLLGYIIYLVITIFSSL